MQPILGGQSELDYLELSQAERELIVEISSPVAADGSYALCSGTLVGGRVLSAAHCAPAAHSVRGSWGAAEVGTMIVHPFLDLAVLTLNSTCEIPQRNLSREGSEPAIGSRVALGGYGITSEGNPLGLQFAVEQVRELTEDRIVVSAAARQSGACVGDSGGPLLLRNEDGQIAIVGVLSKGAASCRGADTYVRLSAAREWLTANLGSSADVAAPDCGDISTRGRCFGDQNVRCENGALTAQSCAAGCGWSEDEYAYRCVDNGACLGDDWGWCDGNTARSCRSGDPTSIHCDETGLECAYDAQGLVACL